MYIYIYIEIIHIYIYIYIYIASAMRVGVRETSTRLPPGMQKPVLRVSAQREGAHQGPKNGGVPIRASSRRKGRPSHAGLF